MKDYIDILENEIGLLNEAIRYLKDSYQNCQKIKVKKLNEYSSEELIEIEALTARFSRVSDIIMKKIFRYIDEIELELNNSVIDRINSAEKRGLISSAENWMNIRNIRNQIAHEYSNLQLKEIYSNVMNYCEEIFSTHQNIIDYYNNLKNKTK
jgi:hypothetical protein